HAVARSHAAARRCVARRSLSSVCCSLLAKLSARQSPHAARRSRGRCPQLLAVREEGVRHVHCSQARVARHHLRCSPFGCSRDGTAARQLASLVAAPLHSLLLAWVSQARG
ncbi:hypothetical protein Dimus_007389, partial [Dionaea muscipula]